MDIEKDFVWNARDGYAVLEKYVKKYKAERDLKEGEKAEERQTSLVLPSSRGGRPVKEIFDAAFSMDEEIEEIVIPDSVQKIGSMAFNQCANLKKITLSKNLKRLGYFALHDTPVEKAEENWQDGLFLLDGWLIACGDDAASVTIPPSVVGVADYAFYFNRALKRVVLPASVKYIGMRAFAFALSLDEVVIPDTVEEAHWQIFGSDVAIGRLTMPERLYAKQKIGEDVRIGEVRLT